jgi:hypothetical protein
VLHTLKEKIKMKTKYVKETICLVVLFLSACSGKVKQVDLNPMFPELPVIGGQEDYSPLNGNWSGQTRALANDQERDCSIDLSMEEALGRVDIKKLSLNCGNDFSTELDPMAFALAASATEGVQAHDVLLDNKVVGFYNYSRSQFYVRLSEQGAVVSITISQSANGLNLDRYEVSMNGQTWISVTNAALTAK